MKNRPDCILKPGMVHAKMYSTIHKSAMSQQINKTFFFFQNCKSIPLHFHLGDRECNGKRQDRAHRGRQVSGAGRDGVEKRRESYCGGGETTVTATRMQERTMLPTRGTGRWDGEAGREWRTFPNTQVGSRNWGREQRKTRAVDGARAGPE